MLNPSRPASAARPLPCSIEQIEETEGFRRLRPEWDGLLASSRSDSIFLTWEWLFTWWKHLAGRRRLSILAVRSAGELIAIAPLALRPPDYGRLTPFRALEFLGTGSVGSDYLDLIVRAGQEPLALPALAGHLARGKVMLEMAQIRTGGSLARDLAERIEGRGWSLTASSTSVCPYIDLEGRTWASYLAGLGPAHRANLQRRLRNMERSFEWSFREAESEEERREFLGHLIDLHHLRRQELGGSDAFNTPGLLAFHEEFSALAAPVPSASRRETGRGALRIPARWHLLLLPVGVRSGVPQAERRPRRHGADHPEGPGGRGGGIRSPARG
jgi:CelD/BcsL family acetyltransferase involved in cellulose biosynthesis